MFNKIDRDREDPRLARYDHLIVHCSATPPSLDVDSAWVDRVHKAKGWRGCGYHAVITRDGSWQDSDEDYLTRPIGQVGSHVGGCGRGWNGRSFGICLMGGVDEVHVPQSNYTKAQMETLAEGVAVFLRIHPDGEGVKVMGHRDLIAQTGAAPKACPCFEVRPWFDHLGIALGKRLTDPSGATFVDLPETHKIRAGETLWSIASTYGVSVDLLKSLNGRKAKPVNNLQVGVELRVRP